MHTAHTKVVTCIHNTAAVSQRDQHSPPNIKRYEARRELDLSLCQLTPAGTFDMHRQAACVQLQVTRSTTGAVLIQKGMPRSCHAMAVMSHTNMPDWTWAACQSSSQSLFSLDHKASHKQGGCIHCAEM
jgi:hypothetical protein